MKKLSKKGYSTGFTWVFGLVTVFGLGVMYIVFDQVFTAHLVPTITNITVSNPNIDPAIKLQIVNDIAKYMAFFRIMPFVLFFVVVIYMIVAAIRKERETEFM